MKTIFKNLKLKRRMYTWLAAMHVFGNPSGRVLVVGVTGTSGKTTTATLLYRVATALGHKAGLLSTVENIIAGKVMPATHTTPDPLNLNKLFKQMVDAGCEYVFMEVSSHALDQNRVAGVQFAGGIFTNLSHDHLDYHKTIEEYFKAKKKFFKMLSTNAFALANTDDEQGLKMMLDIKAQKKSFGFAGGENFHGEIQKMDINGLELEFNQEKINSKLRGKFNAYNLLGVWSACKLLGFDMSRVNKILENVEPPAGRFEPYVTPLGVLVIVDYAHKPDALENIFDALKTSFPDSRIISVVGCGGDRDPSKRPKMGKIAAQNSAVAIFTSDNPRSEDPDKIIEMMKGDLSVEEHMRVKTIADRRAAIRESIQLAQKGDIILCAGKGHEDYQEIRGVKHHFNDIEEYKRFNELK